MVSQSPLPITILIADDHEMTRRGIRDFLKLASDMQVIGEAQDGDEIKRLVAELRPKLLLLDFIMPHLDPVELERWVRENYPDTITLILSSHQREAYLASMIEAGAVGYLDKKLHAGELISAIRRAAYGHSLFTKEQIERARRWREEVTAKWESLSDREREILQKLTEGMENKAIANSLNITVNTVEKHLANIYKKLAVTSRAEAVHWWDEKDYGNP